MLQIRQLFDLIENFRFLAAEKMADENRRKVVRLPKALIRIRFRLRRRITPPLLSEWQRHLRLYRLAQFYRATLRKPRHRPL